MLVRKRSPGRDVEPASDGVDRKPYFRRDDALLDAVYGIAGNEADVHLRGCADCARRLHEWQEKRASTVASIEIPGDFLAAQRRKIYERIERPSRKHWLWAPGLAAAYGWTNVFGFALIPLAITFLLYLLLAKDAP